MLLGPFPYFLKFSRSILNSSSTYRATFASIFLKVLYPYFPNFQSFRRRVAIGEIYINPGIASLGTTSKLKNQEGPTSRSSYLKREVSSLTKSPPSFSSLLLFTILITTLRVLLRSYTVFSSGSNFYLTLF